MNVQLIDQDITTLQLVPHGTHTENTNYEERNNLRDGATRTGGHIERKSLRNKLTETNTKEAANRHIQIIPKIHHLWINK